MPNPKATALSGIRGPNTALSYDRISAVLAGMSDVEIEALAATAAGRKRGVGGHTGTVTVGGTPVFVKSVPVTGLELDHPGSTANLFGLPMNYHYGIGSAGFGAWRELAVHTMTTGWVLDGTYPGFPVMYHSRVLPHEPPPVDVEHWAAHWHHDPAIRLRLEALAGAPAVVTLFLELLPYTMDLWLSDHPAPEWADAELRTGAGFLRSRGLLHLDAHFDNLLTDGHRVYFADFGLALHEGFDLEADERAFLDRHRDYDVDYVRGHLNHWLTRHGLPGVAGNEEPARRTLAFWRRLESDRRAPYQA
ncbi:serine/threonine protein phosphatase [Actinoplanes sp. NPDC049265]|uniref:serine/threonine protein phosphatase n=1 Tax=Actinoplanes sp. NPDC049265 TaxID=3363902 RepID=UPI003723B566